MKITVVVDNCVHISTSKAFIGEHGLALLIELAGKRILVDAGQSSAIINNLSLLGVHVRDLDAIVISHGHYDHAGGLFHLLKHRGLEIPIYAHPDIFMSRYSKAHGKYHIGLPHRKEELESLGAKWQLSDKPLMITDNLWFSGYIPRTTSYEHGDTKLVYEGENCDCQDPINDDSSLYYKTEEGLVVISGCAHTGLVNTVMHGFEITGESKLKGWIGGTHLGPVSESQQVKTLEFLKEQNPSFIAANHCTGFMMMAELARIFNKKFIPAFVGTEIEC